MQMRYSKLFYFFIFAALASLLPFLALYYEQIGLSGGQIGLLVGIPPLVSLVSATLFGAIADATRQHKLLLLTTVSGYTLSVLALSQVTQFGGLVVVMFVYALFFAPILPLVDKTTLDLLGNNKEAYGRQRLWGSLGFGLAAPAAGVIIEATELHWAFYICGGLLLVLVLVSTRLPVGQVELGGHFWQGLRLLVTSWRWAVFLAVVFIGGAALSVNTNYLFLYLAELGASKSWMGLSQSLATVSEVVILFFSAQLMARFGTRGLLIISMLFWVIRLLSYAVATSAAVVIALQLLHGPSFAIMLVAGVAHANRLAPAGMGATAQGLFSGVMLGLGAAFGAIVGGFTYQSLGLAAMFGWAGAGVLLALFLFVAAGRVVANRRLKAATAEVKP